MSTKMYEGEITLSPEHVDVMKKVFVNHLVLYNYSLDILHENRGILFNDYISAVREKLDSVDLTPIIRSAVIREAGYQYKKHKRGVSNKKQITNIQYLTITTGGYDNSQFVTNDEKNKITLIDLGVEMNLESPLPDKEDKDFLYFNISYSSTENKFMLCVFGDYS